MKKTLIALAAAAMVFTAVSCGEKEKGTSSEGVNAETTIEVSAGELMKDISERAAVEKADIMLRIADRKVRYSGRLERIDS